MANKKRFMEAVAEKVGGKRMPMMRRKGGKPGMAVMIAIGAPKSKPTMGEDKAEDKAEAMDGEEQMSKADRIAALQEKIASLKAELALLEDEDEMEEVEEEAYEQDAEMEDEDED
jgi:hypothetical protein